MKKRKVGKVGSKQFKDYHNDAVKKYRKSRHVVALRLDTVRELAKRCPSALTVDLAIRSLLKMKRPAYKYGTVLDRYRT